MTAKPRKQPRKAGEWKPEAPWLCHAPGCGRAERWAGHPTVHPFKPAPEKAGEERCVHVVSGDGVVCDRRRKNHKREDHPFTPSTGRSETMLTVAEANRCSHGVWLADRCEDCATAPSGRSEECTCGLAPGKPALSVKVEHCPVHAPAQKDAAWVLCPDCITTYRPGERHACAEKPAPEKAGEERCGGCDHVSAYHYGLTGSVQQATRPCSWTGCGCPFWIPPCFKPTATGRSETGKAPGEVGTHQKGERYAYATAPPGLAGTPGVYRPDYTAARLLQLMSENGGKLVMTEEAHDAFCSEFPPVFKEAIPLREWLSGDGAPPVLGVPVEILKPAKGGDASCPTAAFADSRSLIDSRPDNSTSAEALSSAGGPNPPVSPRTDAGREAGCICGAEASFGFACPVHSAPAQKDAGRRWVCDATDCRRSFKNEQDEGCFHFLPGSPSEGDPRVYCTTETFTAYVPEAELLAEREQFATDLIREKQKLAAAVAERDALRAELERLKS